VDGNTGITTAGEVGGVTEDATLNAFSEGKMRWTKYDGIRIARPGHRTHIELGSTIRFGPTRLVYGYVWTDGDSFSAYVERERPGEIEDVELGRFTTERAARKAVEAALTSFYPEHL
jgi:hypothetical protein